MVNIIMDVFKGDNRYTRTASPCYTFWRRQKALDFLMFSTDKKRCRSVVSTFNFEHIQDNFQRTMLGLLTSYFTMDSYLYA